MGSSVFKPLIHLSTITNYPYVDFIFVTFAVLFIINAVTTFYRLLKMRWASEKAFADFPIENRHPIFGHVLLVKLNSEETIQDIAERADIFPYTDQLWLGPFHALLICYHPDTMKPVLSSSEPKDEFTYGMVKPWLGDVLLISKGSKWFRNRRLLTPGFHFDILRPYVHIFNECTHTMMDKWMKQYDNGMIEMFEHVSLMTLDSLMKCIFSIETHCQTEVSTNPYITAVYELSEMVVNRINFPPYFSDLIFHLTYSGYKWRRALRQVHGHSKTVIHQRKQALEEQKELGIKHKRKYIDFLDILLEARDENGKGLTDQEIQDEVDTFMFEGHDTTASGISWILYNIAKHTEHQRKCQEEIDELMEQKDKDVIEWDDLSKLPYLTMCIKESLQLHPPVPFIGRKLSKPIEMPSPTGNGKVTIPAGERIGLPIIGLHHNPHVWEDPEVYNPLRFTPENSKGRSPHAYLPFSAGPR
ncbi:cytochrome P450 4F3-like [Saccoglossus kowalevskii]|uniref:Leukotriene-B(4) omega-hydroxylase 2-like n=1 Tax=Saccoglossus kowalevskii TaxID=10224 RepID=A0ABM0GWU6_SACKO|nr:PREDICTED: leukotriene-B(4) omega-hydroxylase 2-like [Saccoglossus kowalevskii]